MSGALTKPQLREILERLPAGCVFDAIDGMKPPVSVVMARFALLNCEAEGLVSWQREPPQTIALTAKGSEFLSQLT